MKEPLVIHMVVDRLFPQSGGLEASAMRLARSLSAHSLQTNVYVRSKHFKADTWRIPEDDSSLGLTIKPLSLLRERIEEPLTKNRLFFPDATFGAENWADSLILRNLINQSIRENGSAKHIILSFSLVYAGFIAQHVALSLELQHVASVRGSDFTLGLHAPTQLPVFTFVATNADLIVTTNNEQLRFIQSAFGRKIEGRCIHNALSPMPEIKTASARPRLMVRLFSDCGYSFRKGTNILLDAFTRVAGADQDVHLTIAGGTPPDEQTSKAYWLTRIEELKCMFPQRFHPMGLLSKEELLQYLYSADIYCSASLGEGCSSSRMSALAAGLPIVTTLCGEMKDFGSEAGHVFLADPGDGDGFSARILEACSLIRHNQLSVDYKKVEDWRLYFQLERETSEWVAAIESLP